MLVRDLVSLSVKDPKLSRLAIWEKQLCTTKFAQFLASSNGYLVADVCLLPSHKQLAMIYHNYPESRQGNRVGSGTAGSTLATISMDKVPANAGLPRPSREQQYRVTEQLQFSAIYSYLTYPALVDIGPYT